MKIVFSSKHNGFLPTEQVKQQVIQALPNLRRFAYSLAGNRTDADDLVQSLVERLITTSIPSDANPIAWMLRVCRNMWIDEVRKRQTAARHMVENQHEAVTKPVEEVLIIEAEQKRVIQAIAALPAAQREVLTLVAISGLTYADAANVLEVPVGTVMSRLARARSAMADMINQGSEEE